MKNSTKLSPYYGIRKEQIRKAIISNKVLARQYKQLIRDKKI